MSVIPLSRAARSQPYFWALQDAGVDVERRLSRAHIPSNLLYDPDMVVSSVTVGQFIARTARKQGIEDIALLGAARDGVQNLEPWLKDYLLGATTLNQLMERYCRVAEQYIPYRKYTIERFEGLFRICSTADDSLRNEAFLRLSDWSNILLLQRILRRILGQDFSPSAITFQTKAPLTQGQREALGSSDIYQASATTSIAFPRELLATSIPDALRHGPIPELAQEHAGALGFSTMMRDLLKPCLSEDWLNINTAAEMVGCSSRTLQRRLSATGLTFSGIVDQARMDVAKTLLKQQDSCLIDIGMEVGYSDPAHFSRAFRRVNGVTPSQYRASTVTDSARQLRA